MVHRKRIGINLVALITAIGLTATLFGEPVLVSIKKGTEGNKSWAVFSFEGDVEWSGVSQSSDGKLSLYFKGGSGDLNGSSVILDARQDNRVYVKQLSQTPPIFRADIIFNVNQPIVILRKENHMIVAFNDERLVSTNAQLSSEDVTFTSTLYQVKPEWLAEYMKISFNFDSDFQWAGYVRHSSDHVDLIFMGAEHNLSEESLTFSKGPLHTVQLYHSTDPVVKLKASLWFKGVSNFSIAKKGNQILTQAYYPETELIASTKSVPSNINPKAREPEPLFTDAELDKAKTNETKYDTQDMDALLNLPSASAVTPAAEPLVTTQSADKTQNTQDESFAGSTMQMVDEIEKQKDGVLWDTPVSFEFRSTPIKDALRLVAKTNDLNMVIGDEVDGSVTMTLSEVTLRQALEKIVVTNGFEYIVDDNIIIVKTVRAKYAGGRVTKVYRLKYADAANVASVIKNIVTSDSLVQVFYPEFLQFIDDQQSQGGGGGGGQRYPGAGMSRMQASPQSIQGIRRASILVVTERPDMIREIDDLVRELDAPSTQIVIEARFYELNPENTNQMGINWQETWNVFNYMPNDLGILPGFSIESEQAAIAQWDWRSGHLNPLQYQAVLQFLSEQK
ncbi:hypothetical protein HQ585_15380, partial [candidate division KSB1 bacterium]|nr:hypothetical protein [candidate division KSB1 bacterium]